MDAATAIAGVGAVGTIIGAVAYVARLEPRIQNVEKRQDELSGWLERVEGKLDEVILSAKRK